MPWQWTWCSDDSWSTWQGDDWQSSTCQSDSDWQHSGSPQWWHSWIWAKQEVDDPWTTQSEISAAAAARIAFLELKCATLEQDVIALHEEITRLEARHRQRDEWDRQIDDELDLHRSETRNLNVKIMRHEGMDVSSEPEAEQPAEEFFDGMESPSESTI